MSKGQINFDSKDWRSIEDTIAKINEAGCMQVGETDEGEMIIFDVTCDGSLHTQVRQSNGWIRHNYYDPEDLTVSESYERG